MPDSFATSSIVVLPSPNRATHSYVAASSRSRWVSGSLACVTGYMMRQTRAVTSASEFIKRDRAVVWHGFTQMAAYGDNRPIIVERAEGHELIDVDGNRYLDAISSLWVTTLGHCVPE